MNNNLILLSSYPRRQTVTELLTMHLPVIEQALCYCANEVNCPVQELAATLHGEIMRAQREERG